MQLSLEGLNVLVTGGTKGIGRAIVEAFLQEGANVAYCARTIPENNLFGDLEKQHKVRAIGTAFDVKDEAQLEGWVQSSAKTLGSIDVVVPNVSALSPDYEAAFNIDLMSTVRLVEASLPYLEQSRATGGGSIVSVGSVSGHELDAFAGAYGSFKAALTHYTQGIARKMAAKHVRANTVSPGNIYFEGGVWGNAERDNPAFFKEILDMNPTGRMGTPKEVANAVLFLASSVSSFTTGANLIVDGANHKGVAF